MKSSRREFLKQLGAAGTALPFMGLSPLTLAAQWARAASPAENDFNFILFRVPGAMDSTLGLHPWTESLGDLSEQNLFLGYDPLTNPLQRIQGTQISLGPSAEPIAPFVRQMAVVRGVYMGANDLGHPMALRHMTAGRTQETSPHVAAYLGQKHSSIGAFVLTNSPLQRGIVAPFPLILTQTLKQLADPSFQPTSSSLGLYRDSSLASNRYLEIVSQKDKLEKFRTVFNSTSTPGSSSSRRRSLDHEALALAGLASGLTRVVQLDLDGTGTLDTHAAHAFQHPNSQKSRWTKIAKFLKGLQDQKILDKTLVMVATEFNRTPGLNASAGKDHNYTDNAVALFGRGLNGGSVFGDHTLFRQDKHRPYASWAGKFIDFGTADRAGTGQVVELDPRQVVDARGNVNAPAGVDLIRPADVWTSVVSSLDPELVRQLSSEGKVIPGLFRSGAGK